MDTPGGLGPPVDGRGGSDARADIPPDPGAQDGGAKLRIASVDFKTVYRDPRSHGDVWTASECANGALYAAVDDTETYECSSSNLALVMLDPFVPFSGIFKSGKSVNCMTSGTWNYGPMTSTQASPTSTSTAQAMWKANGLLCVSEPGSPDRLIMTVSRHHFAMVGNGQLQDTFDATFIVSRDAGATWTPKPALVAADSTIAGRRFTTPFFIQYGAGAVANKDGAEEFLYAVANDGYWNNGNAMYLARIRRSALDQIRASKSWEFYGGLAAGGQPAWVPAAPGAETAANALPILEKKGQMSMTGAQYIAELDLYLMFQWHYPNVADPSISQWTLYQAPHPWGPWTPVPGGSHMWNPQGYYNYATVASWARLDEPTSTLKMIVSTAGNYRAATRTTDLNVNPYYRLNLVELTFHLTR